MVLVRPCVQMNDKMSQHNVNKLKFSTQSKNRSATNKINYLKTDIDVIYVS